MENNIKSVTAHYRQQTWANIISERNASGLNVKDWCRINHVKESAYYYWIRKIHHSLIDSFALQNAKADKFITYNKPSLDGFYFTHDSLFIVCALVM